MVAPAERSKSTLIQQVEAALLAGWKLVLGGAILGFIFAVFQLRGAVYSYPVQMQLTSVQSNSSDGGSSRQLSQLSGLASLANIALPTTQNAMQFQLFTDSLYTRDLAEDMAQNSDIMLKLYGYEWDQASLSWHEPPVSFSTRVFLGIRAMLGLAPSAPWQPPGGAEMQSFLSNSLVMAQDPRKPYMAVLTLSSPDKAFAIHFLNVLAKTADDRLRRQALSRATTYINYLKEKLATVSIAEDREAIAQALGEQYRYQMVASSNRPFAAEIFESPWASNAPSSPSPRQTFMIFVALGALCGLGISYLRLNYSDRMPAWLQDIMRNLKRRFG